MLTKGDAVEIMEKTLTRLGVNWPRGRAEHLADDLEKSGAFQPDKPTSAPVQYCDQCDGCGWYEGGPTLKTTCEHCNGTGIAPVQGANAEKIKPLKFYPETGAKKIVDFKHDPDKAIAYRIAPITKEELTFLRAMMTAVNVYGFKGITKEKSPPPIPKPGDTVLVRTGNRKAYKPRVLKSIVKASTWAGGYRIMLEGSKNTYGANHIKGWKKS